MIFGTPFGPTLTGLRPLLRSPLSSPHRYSPMSPLLAGKIPLGMGTAWDRDAIGMGCGGMQEKVHSFIGGCGFYISRHGVPHGFRPDRTEPVPPLAWGVKDGAFLEAGDQGVPWKRTELHMEKVTPFLSFTDGRAEEAARFYVSLLPDSRIDRVTRSPMDTPGAATGDVILVEFTLAGRPYIALNATEFVFTEAFSFSVATADQEETDRLWATLTADGGSEVYCGWCKDRFGVSWQITPTRLMELIRDQDQGRAFRAMEAMTKMVKIDIAALEAAADRS